jgi:protein-disulfide isomerase
MRFLLVFTILVFCSCSSEETEAKQHDKPDQQLSHITNDDYVKISYGNAKAKIEFIEYASMTCPACGNFHTNELPIIKQKYLETGQVKFIYRDFPTDKLSLISAMLTRCIAKQSPDTAVKIIDILYNNQPKWLGSKDAITSLTNYFLQVGFNEQDVNTCLNNDNLRDTILNNQLYASKHYGLRATPSIIINQKLYDGERNHEEIIDYIDALLEQQN